MRVCDILFVGLLKPEARHVNTTYCPPEVLEILKKRGRSMDEVQDELTGKKSITGISELDLRKIAVDNFDYKALQRQRHLRYCSIPANAVQVEDHNYLAFATSVCAVERARDHTHEQRVEKNLFDPNIFKQIAVILLKCKLHLHCITNMSVEDVIAGYRARGILDHDVLSDCLVTLSKHWCTINAEGVAIGLCPKKPEMTAAEATYTIQAFDYIWNCTEVVARFGSGTILHTSHFHCIFRQAIYITF